MPRCTCWISALFLTSCSAPAHEATDAAQTWVFHDDATGVGFELPARWQVTESGPAVVFSGPPGTGDYFTTITLQATPCPEHPGRASNDSSGNNAARRPSISVLDEVLDSLLTELGTLPGYAFHLREPVILGTRPALRYGLQVELHESLRWKHGVLFLAAGAVVHVAYSATPELFPTGIPVFERLIDSLAVVDTTP